VTELTSVLRQINDHLKEAGVSFALLGGLAVSVRTKPRFTQDADLAVAVANDAEAEALIHRLGAYGYRVLSVVEQGAVGRLATVRLSGADEDQDEDQTPIIDLLFASSGIESEIVRP
jgi:hypothetical protein